MKSLLLLTAISAGYSGVRLTSPKSCTTAFLGAVSANVAAGHGRRFFFRWRPPMPGLLACESCFNVTVDRCASAYNW